MDMVKNIWAYSFKVQKKDVNSLVVNLIVWIVAAVVAGVLIGFAVGLDIPFVSGLLGVVGGLVDLYCLIGIVLSVLVYLDVLKD